MFLHLHPTSRRKRVIFPVAVGALLTLAASASAALITDLPDMSAVGDFAVFGNDLNLANVTVNGDVGVSANGSITLMAASTVNGNIYLDTGVTKTLTGPYGTLYEPVTLSTAQSQVYSASSTLAGFTADLTYTTWNAPLTITGNGGVNVLKVTGDVNLSSESITLTGSANDYFVINVLGGLSLGGSGGIVAGTGVDPSHILINIIGTGSKVTAQVNNHVDGTILVPDRQMEFHSISGAVYGGTLQIKLMSDATVTYVPPAGANPSALGNFVWHDLNADGIQDPGELGIPNITVNLLDGSGNPTGITTTTDANGFYSFTGLWGSSYKVEFIKSGTIYGHFSPQGAGTAATDSNADLLTGITGPITLPAGTTDNTWDAGLYNLCSLGDYVWHDLNHNGKQDAGEPLVPGVTVRLLNSLGDIIGTDVTDASGRYLFDALLPGAYEVEFVLPDGYAFTILMASMLMPDAPTAPPTTDLDSNANLITGRTGLITLTSGQNDMTWDAGLVLVPEPASLALLTLGGAALFLRRRN